MKKFKVMLSSGREQFYALPTVEVCIAVATMDVYLTGDDEKIKYIEGEKGEIYKDISISYNVMETPFKHF